MRWAWWMVMAAACSPAPRPELGGDGGGSDAPGDSATDDPCSPVNLGDSYIGCDYYPTITGNTVGTLFDFAVAIANTTNDPAEIRIDGGALEAPTSFDVPPGAVRVEKLPWVPALKLCDTVSTDGCLQPAEAALAAKGSYHLRSSQPVTVYQFSALQYQKSNEFSFSNDASLLLPTNAWRKRYFAAGWKVVKQNASELAITAMRDGTHVTLNARASTLAAGGAPAFAANTPQTVTLDAGDVLEVTSHTGDLTGSEVTADQPVQVIGGHYCAAIPTDDLCCCDHLEESMFSVDALGKQYVVSAPAVTGLPDGKTQIVRVIATEPNTTLTYDPPQGGAPATIASAGDAIAISSAAAFMIRASHKILVASYMTGQNAGGNTGDPAMALAVPVDQYRTAYLFHAPTNYEINYVDVTAPMGAHVLLDGEPLTGFVPIGATGYGLKRVAALSNGVGGGNHSIAADAKVGITVYGYGQYTSYWYPGGLNLGDLVP